MTSTLKWKLIALFFLGLVFFNFPILELFAIKTLIFGIPALFFYLFIIWFIYIIILRQLVDSTDQKKLPK